LLEGIRDTAPDRLLFEVLEAVGGEASVAGLTRYIESSKDPYLKDRAATKKTLIEAKLKKKSGG
jgi:hypothetical protein